MTLGRRLGAGQVLFLPAEIGHARRGAIRHAFAYRADYILFAPEEFRGSGLLRRNRFGLFSVNDADHGGERGRGRGAAWAWERLAGAGLPRRDGQVLALLTQPRFLGRWFNPVSFWLLFEDDALLAVIAEVNNTFGQRHSYLCLAPDGGPIRPDTPVSVAKRFHVSPFQDVGGAYRFTFALSQGSVAIRIRHLNGGEGLDATLRGVPEPLRAAALLRAALRRPGGPLRVLALIYWNALRLRLKGARFRPLPAPPENEISR